MSEKWIKIVGYTAFSIGIIVFGKLSLETLNWYGFDIPGIESSQRASDIDWMLEKVDQGNLKSPEFASYKASIENLKKKKLMFSIAGFIACLTGLIFIFIRKKATS